MEPKRLPRSPLVDFEIDIGGDVEQELVRAEVARGLFGDAGRPVRRGRFELLRRRGRGAMGVVYEALDTERGDRVALKLLTRLDARAIGRLKREFRSLSAMDHPNLVRLDALFHQQGQWFFSMELVEGKPFDQFVREAGVERTPSLSAALRQLVAAVSAIHAAGKFHRDLKPSNVLVTEDGRVVVLDFGLVHDEHLGGESALTQSDIVGTPAYMAPELARGGTPTNASDWYSVGVMLFEALTGRLPFEGNTLSVLNEKQYKDAPDPLEFEADLPPELREVCALMLKRDPAQRADGACLLRALGSEAPVRSAQSTPKAAASVFVGREHELEVLAAGLERAKAGEPVSILLHSASGVGKSALLEQFALLSAGDALVLRGRCHQQESVPYKVFDGVLDALSAHLRRLGPDETRGLLPRHLSALLQLFPTLGHVPTVAKAAAVITRPSEARELRNQAFAALKELLLRITDRTPVVIVVDDLQWGDVDSARMLASVLGAPEPPALLFVGAYRSDEARTSEFLRAVLTEDSMLLSSPQRLELAPLPPAAASELARKLLGPSAAAMPSVTDAIAAESAGVPFFITELTRHISSTGTHDRTPRGGLSLERLILIRVAALPLPAQRLLQVLSVAGGPLEVSVANEAAGLPRNARAALLALRSARLSRLRQGASGELAESYHDRIRETIAGAMTALERRVTHQMLADALQRHDIADPDRLVLHYSGAGDRVRAGETAFRAGLVASQKLAFNRAVQLFGRTLELLPLPGRQAHDVYRHLGDALANAGHGVAAGDAYLKGAADAQAQEQERAQLRALAAVQYLATPKAEQGMALAREALQHVGVHVPERPLASARAYLEQRFLLRLRTLRPTPRPSPARTRRLNALRDIGPALSWVDGLAGATLQTLYLREALDSGDPEHILHALTSETIALALAGGPRQERKASHQVAQLMQIANRTGTSYARALVQLAEANRLFWTARRYSDALDHAAQAEELFAREAGGLAWERASIALVQMVAHTFVGDLRKLAILTGAHERDARERDDQFVPLMLTSSRAMCHLIEDRPDDAIALLESMRSRLPLSIHFRYTWQLRMAEALSYVGRSQQGFELTEAYWPELHASYLRYSEYVRYIAVYYRARAAMAAYQETGDRKTFEIARRATGTLPDDASSHGANRAALMGALHQADGEIDKAVAMMQLARDRFRACQSELNALHAERCLYEFTADAAATARVDAALRRDGVVNPQRWVWTYIPTR